MCNEIKTAKHSKADVAAYFGIVGEFPRGVHLAKSAELEKIMIATNRAGGEMTPGERAHLFGNSGVRKEGFVL